MEIVMRRLALLPLSLTAACASAGSGAATSGAADQIAAGPESDRGAFIVRLGADTIAVERYTRTGDRIEGDEAMRTPATSLRHYVATVAPDGAITSLDYDARRLNGSVPPTRGEMRFGADTTTVHLTAGGRDTTLHYAARGASPYVNLSYALLEAMFMRHRATAGDSVVVPVVALGAPAPLNGTLRRVGSDSMTFAIFETTPYRARVDARGRILGLAGLGTTQQVMVERVADVDVQATAAEWARRDSAGQALGVLSPTDSVKASVAGAQLAVVYSRPALRGRSVMGNLVPYDKIWRTGANAATMFRTDRDLVIGGTTVPAGSYTLWTLASANGAKLVINKQTGQWGTDYDASRDLARVDATVRSTASPVERFTFAIEPTGGKAGAIRYTWGTTEFVVPFTVR
jgi:hypothetical protein